MLNLYASGLDLEALIPRLRRVHTTLITSALAILLLYLGVFALNAVDSITAMTLVLNGLAGPWVAILLVGFLTRREEYDPEDLQGFIQGRRGGRYWYTGGWNLRAVAAFVLGSMFGLLSVNTTRLYVGPLANLAQGVDLSVVGSAVIAAVAFWIFQRVWPDPVQGARHLVEQPSQAATQMEGAES